MYRILQQIIDLSTRSELDKFMKGVMPSICIGNVWYRYPDYPEHPEFPVFQIKYPIEEDVILATTGKTE